MKDQLAVIKEAVKEVPSVKWALGVAGIGAAASILSFFFTNLVIGLLFTGGVLLLSYVLFFFSKMTTSRKTWKRPLMVFTWFFTILIPSVILASVTSLFGDWPLERCVLLGTDCGVPPPTFKASVYAYINGTGEKISDEGKIILDLEEKEEPATFHGGVAQFEAILGRYMSTEEKPVPIEYRVSFETFILAEGQNEIKLSPTKRAKIRLVKKEEEPPDGSVVDEPGIPIRVRLSLIDLQSGKPCKKGTSVSIKLDETSSVKETDDSGKFELELPAGTTEFEYKGKGINGWSTKKIHEGQQSVELDVNAKCFGGGR